MATSRRDFVKTTLAASVGIAAGTTAEAQVLPHASHTAVTQHNFNQHLSAEFTRGIGVYPGDPEENFSPSLQPATKEYRNLALLRPAYHSSSYDYNLTAQLVTDGIKHERTPRYVSVSVDGRVLTKPDREIILDHFQSSLLEVIGARPVIEIHVAGGEAPLTVDQLGLFLSVPANTDRSKLRFTAFSSPDGRTWKALGSVGAPSPIDGDNYPPDLARGNALLAPSIKFDMPQQVNFYRVQLEIAGASEEHFSARWGLGEVEFGHGGTRVEVGGPYSFTSAWKSAGVAEEWVYVDLGNRCTFDRVNLNWISPAAAGKIQISDDAKLWRDVAAIHGGKVKEEISIAPAAHARFVRALLTRPSSADGYVLSEFEIFGSGGVRVQPKPMPNQDKQGNLHLAGGSWRVQRSDQVNGNGLAISQAGFKDADWVVATVPGTVLTSYLNAGAIPDPNFGANQLFVSDSYFYSDFWYRTEFMSPSVANGELQWLDFAGINWKANIFLNGEKLGRIEGAFQRARYNISGKLKMDQPNVLAVLIEKNATPGSAKQKTFESPGKNGGALGADNPTFHSSVGWDWIPTIRGRNTGIWNAVNLITTTSVTITDPAVTSILPLPNTSPADVTVRALLTNHGNQPISGTLHCSFGNVLLQQPVTLAGGERKQLSFTPQSHPELAIHNPRLWWPAGYGEANLYDVVLRFAPNGGPESRPLAFQAGIRQITASEEGGNLRLFVNGRRVVAKGGNWGFSESMLRYRAREYDAAVRYHREMNFNMIRNWVGQIGEDAFYEACDRHGVLVWQDFWLANPWDGPIPNDNKMFLQNARDLLLRIRMHPCVGIYCGRNEWFPPKPLDDGLRALLAELHPDLHYIGSSADGPVSGHGPYQALPAQNYFQIAGKKLHSEIGSPNIPSFASLQQMMPASAQWPQALEWGLHDFCLKGAQGGESFRSIIDESYGGAANAKEWVELAQFVNYDVYRAMFEAQGKDRMGVLLWMSHPCWPSFVWQTYDYYLEPTSAYFACKKACEPLHIQWNPLTETVDVVNSSGGDQNILTARLQVLDDKGAVISTQSSTLNSSEDSHAEAFPIKYPASLPSIHFLQLELMKDKEIISKNFYHRGRDAGDFRGLRALPPARLTAETTVARAGGIWTLQTSVQNVSQVPALMVRVSAVRGQTKERILPAIFSDNYVAVLPGQSEKFVTQVKQADTGGEAPRIVLDGFNLFRS